MSGQLTTLHLAILVLAGIGFGALAFATDRHGEQLLGRMPAPQWRLLARVLGWVMLAVALALGIVAWGSGVGITVWLGWLTIAGASIAFALPRWQARKAEPRRARPAARADKAGADEAEAAARLRRQRTRQIVSAVLAVVTVAIFVLALARTQAGPLKRDDAIQGQAGPWSFVLAQADEDPPEIVDMDVALKAFRVRFCEECDADIRHAFLKVNQPRSMRAAGMALEGARWERRVEIQMPENLTAESELWLTVVGKDGNIHQAHWPMSRVSPATVAWAAAHRKPHEDE